MAHREVGQWNVLRFGAGGFLLGAALTGAVMLAHPQSVLFNTAPIAAAIFGGLMGLVVLGGAAISRNQFSGAMARFRD